jgi:hypothetical protein
MRALEVRRAQWDGFANSLQGPEAKGRLQLQVQLQPSSFGQLGPVTASWEIRWRALNHAQWAGVSSSGAAARGASKGSLVPRH